MKISKSLFIEVVALTAILAGVLAVWHFVGAASSIDVTGGKVLVYSVEMQNTAENQRKKLCEDVVSVLKKRFPSKVRNVSLQVTGEDKFEVKIGFESLEAKQKRQSYEKVIKSLPEPMAKSLQYILNTSSSLEECEGNISAMIAEYGQKPEIANNLKNIQKSVELFEQYRPYHEAFMEPDSVQRLLKGAGLLEFRILVSPDSLKLSEERIDAYVEALTEKGPDNASDGNYVWCKIHNPEAWIARGASGSFNDNMYVLLSNQPDECMLHNSTQKWAIKRAYLTPGGRNRKAIGFSFDKTAAGMFYKLTDANIDKQLCILLDDIALSAPRIMSAISSAGMITGNFTPMEQSNLINVLNAGQLPVRISDEPISIRTINPKKNSGAVSTE